MSLGWAILGGLAFGPLGFIGGCLIGNDNTTNNYHITTSNNLNDDYPEEQQLKDLNNILELYSNSFLSIEQIIDKLNIPYEHWIQLEPLFQEYLEDFLKKGIDK